MLNSRLPLLLAASLLSAASSPLRAQGLPEQQPEQARPPGLVILERRTVPYGQQVTGIYAVRPADDIANGKRLKVWEEKVNDVKVRNETLLCSVSSPARITSSGSQLLMQELNPGGAIGPHNKLSHLIWWAGCHPEQAGKDPAELVPLARKLGFSGTIQEREHLLPGNPR